jgi:hypothetical protein
VVRVTKMEETLTKNVKKVIKWGQGLAVFITTEAKLLGWTSKDHVIISTVREGKEEKIILTRLKI